MQTVACCNICVSYHISIFKSWYDPAICCSPVWEKKLLSSEEAQQSCHCCRAVLSAGFSWLLPLLSPAHICNVFFTPCMNSAFSSPQHLYGQISPPLCASIIQPVCIRWPRPHYRHNSAAAGSLSHRHHCRIPTHLALILFRKRREWGGEKNAESQKQVRGRKMEDEREKSFTETKWFIKLQMT